MHYCHPEPLEVPVPFQLFYSRVMRTKSFWGRTQITPSYQTLPRQDAEMAEPAARSSRKPYKGRAALGWCQAPGLSEFYSREVAGLQRDVNCISGRSRKRGVGVCADPGNLHLSM